MVRVLVTGDRDWYAPEFAEAVVNRLIARYGLDLVIVHGAATGIDQSFAEACEALGVEHEPHPADGSRGRYADPIRNAQMVRLGADLCIAFHLDLACAKGTKDCARRAILAGISTYLVEDETGTPQRLVAEDPRLA